MRGRTGKAGRNGEITIIRREEVVEAGHHGGAWKVAYADFVTAMMAFFLLMWLLNATTEDQRKGLADYFSPNNLLSHASSGTGQPFGGHTAFDKGGLVSDRGAVQVIAGNRPVVTDPDDEDPTTPQAAETSEPRPATASPSATAEATPPAPTGTKETGEHDHEVAPAADQAQREKQAFEQAAEQLKEAVKDDPALSEIARQLAIDLTPEGLRIQMLDEERSAMFATGSASLNERAQLLLSKVAPVLMRLPEDIAVVGHTDATPFAGNGRSNWELSTERANATRRLLVDAGLTDTRVSRVTGLADRDPLLPADPYAAANRRIAIIVLYGAKRPQTGAAAAPAAAKP